MPPVAAALVAAAGLAAIYAAVCAVSPATTCSSCGGGGSVKRMLAGVRRCPSCGGVGWKLRAGRRLFAAIIAWRNTRRAGQSAAAVDESSDVEAAA